MRQAHSLVGESHVAEFASSPARLQNTLLRWFCLATRCLTACSLALLAACGGGRNDADLSHGRSSAMNSGAYGLPSNAPTSALAPPPEKWSSYFTERASSDPYGLIGEEGARAKAAASGFVPGTAHRFYNTASGVHFYTLSEQERLWVQANLPHFTYEGQGFFAVTTQVDELSPVYRFYNLRTGSHFYTINPSERDHVIATLSTVFKYEGIAWYGSTVPGPGWFPMYRFFNTATGTHFYTATPAERDNVRDTLPTFNYEGIAYYIRLSGVLDTTLSGIDTNSNGVRDSVEQVLSRLIPDSAEREANMAVAVAYDRILTSPLPSNREEVLISLGNLACSEQSANSSLYESHSNGIARVVLDSDQRVDRFRQLLDVLDGGYLGSELATCPTAKNGTFQPKSAGTSLVFDREVRILFVNGIYNSMDAARDSSSNLSAALEFDLLRNFNFDFFHNPNDGNTEDITEIRAQAQLSANAASLIGRDFIQINSNLDNKKLYYAMLGWSYKDLRLQTTTMTPTQWRITGTTLQLAAKIKQIIEAGGERRLILVPHSQGNFYVEAALGVILDDIRRGRWTILSENQMLDRIRVFGVAPVSATSWNNAYISHNLDQAIQIGLPFNTAGIDHQSIPFNTIAAIDPDWIVWANARQYLESLGADQRAHGFTETYLNQRIIRSEDNLSFGGYVRDQIRAHMVFPLTPPTTPQSRLPHTGITANQCFRAGSNELVSCGSAEAIALSGAAKQDGMRAQISSMQYSDHPSPSGGTYARTECVIDNVTGLIWEGKNSSGLRSVGGFIGYTNFGDGRAGDASLYVTNVNTMALCGYADWRLPTTVELQGLVNYSLTVWPWSSPSLNTSFFPNSSKEWTWSSSPNAGNLYRAWAVNFFEGEVGRLNDDWASSYGGAVRLVRGSRITQTSISSDGQTVTDHASGLIWRRCTEGMHWNGVTCTGSIIAFSHENAFIRARNEAAASNEAWRLPNVKELSSLVDQRRSAPAIDTTLFPNSALIENASAWYWSSTPSLTFPGHARMVDFRYGRSGGALSRESEIAVRLVRDLN